MSEIIGKLFVVSTPIGNLGDMTARAVETLQTVDLIAAEDTRHSAPLLNHFGVDTPTLSLHDFNELERVEQLIKKLERGKNIALISDAGTPLISDPGYKLVAKVRAKNYAVVTVPGACAAVAALSVSGLPTDGFQFEGFLPAKRQAKEKRLMELGDVTKTLIFYESKHRIKATLEVLLDIYSERQLCLCKELTKAHETVVNGRPEEILNWLLAEEGREKGEFVLLIAGAAEQSQSDKEINRVLSILTDELPLKTASALAAKILGENKNRLYKLALAQKDE